MSSRLVPYRTVLQGYLSRRGNGRTTATASEEDLVLAAEFLTSAYRYCLETWQWPEATIGCAITITGSFVPWSTIQGADYFAFWTSDPDDLAATVAARPVPVRREEQDGLHLDTTLTSLWARFTPRAPQFDHVPVEATASYPPDQVVYDGAPGASGHMYRCIAGAGALGSELADPAKWQAQPLLWLLTEPVKMLALAGALGDGEQERAQEADLQRQAELRLNDLSFRRPRV